MKVERVVCDTNVLISAAIVPVGKARAALNRVLRDSMLLLSPEMFEELETRLARPKFRKYLAEEDRLEFLQLVKLGCEWVSIEGRKLGCRDADDDKVLETALNGRADALVTGDGDLLVFRPGGELGQVLDRAQSVYQGVAILRPAEFLRLIDPSSE